ncbi:MAG TPA: glycosyltransferase family 1 protein [Balneolaceae bacterium]|nr:glycosyltransferase family 1 protein [Balneolaceae bacterium]
MKELRVAIFTGNYNHIQDGVSMTLNQLVAYLEKKGIPVIVFGPTDDEPALDHEGEFISVPSVPVPGRQEYRFSMAFPEKAKQRLHQFNPTLVHLATPDLLGLRAMHWAKENNIQIVASYHTHFTSYLKYYHLEMLEGVGWKYAKWFYGQCKHIYVPSPSMANQLKERGIGKEIRIWARGVDTDLFHPDQRSEKWRRKQGFTPEDVVLTFVSRIVWEKNLKIFVEVAKKLQGKVKPMIVGNGPAMDELKEMLPGAHFTGFITGDELACAYASSDIFLFPSETETFGNVTLEAMSSGLPCIVADAPGSKSLVDSGVNGYLAPPHDANEFARYVQKITKDEELRKRMSKTARQKALAYSWDRVNGKLIDDYREAVCEPLLSSNK